MAKCCVFVQGVESTFFREIPPFKRGDFVSLPFMSGEAKKEI